MPLRWRWWAQGGQAAGARRLDIIRGGAPSDAKWSAAPVMLLCVGATVVAKNTTNPRIEMLPIPKKTDLADDMQGAPTLPLL